LVGALPMDAGFLEFIESSKFGPVKAKLAFATILRPTRLAIPTASHSVPLTSITFAAPIIV